MVNRQILLARVGKSPEVRNLDNGQTVANFTVATTESYKDKSGQKKEETTWHNIVLWGKLAELAQKYVDKGDLIYLEGKTRTRSYEKDGITRYSTEVVGDTLRFVSKKGESSPEAPTENNGDGSDDLPF